MSKTILVVEDDPDVAQVIADILRDHDHRITLAQSGEAMRRCLESGSRIDCVVLDAVLPGEPGDMLAEELVRRAIPVLICSGSLTALQSAQRRGLPALAKPFRATELLRSVERAMRSEKRAASGRKSV